MTRRTIARVVEECVYLELWLLENPVGLDAFTSPLGELYECDW